jgi:asparagine synthase (glutamine-hydrolysing)
MSALAGVWRFDGKPGVDDDCARMLAAQQIYGPHDERQWSNGTLAMGRRLFRLVPEDIHDRQPLHSRDGRLTLVADVRLDNREELAAQLGLSSSSAQQLCDAALLLEALDRWGEDALTRLVGDFAFVLWDSPAQRLLLARDFLGQRPLHYHCGRGFFAFASMPKGLHALAEIPYGPDEQVVAEFLVLMPRQGSRTFFRDVVGVEPAHVVAVTRAGIASRRYWQPRRPGGSRLRSKEYVEGLRHHLDQAVRSQLRGVNGAVAAHLSAGFDSSAVTATAARLLAPRGGKVVAFTGLPRAGYDRPSPKGWFNDEGPLAAATAAMYPNIEHVLIRTARESPLDEFDRMVYLYDRPIVGGAGWFSSINRAARDRELTVILTGVLGNMTSSYNGAQLFTELLRAGRFIRLWREASHWVGKSHSSWGGALIKTFGAFLPVWLWRRVERRTKGRAYNVLDYAAIRADYLAERNLATLARERNWDFAGRPWKDGFDLRLWAMGRGARGEVYKGTLAGWGPDTRSPLADKRLVEFCLSVPTDEYLSNGVSRSLARRALADRLPPVVLNEHKQGFQIADWHEAVTAARANIAAEVDRLAAYGPAAKMLDIEMMKNLVDNWPKSGWETHDIEARYRWALLGGIAAGHFLRKTSGAN